MKRFQGPVTEKGASAKQGDCEGCGSNSLFMFGIFGMNKWLSYERLENSEIRPPPCSSKRLHNKHLEWVRE